MQLTARLADGPAGDAPKGVIDSLAAAARIKAPLLVVHGSYDSLVPSRFGRSLYERATAAKRFLFIEGSTHSTTTWRGAEQYRAALREFFGSG